jgi:hypothetical protein
VDVISSEVFIEALVQAGFTRYCERRGVVVLERGQRAIAIPKAPTPLEPHVVAALHRMSGLPWSGLETLLREAASRIATDPR